jgi:serine protease AprX
MDQRVSHGAHTIVLLAALVLTPSVLGASQILQVILPHAPEGNTGTEGLIVTFREGVDARTRLVQAGADDALLLDQAPIAYVRGEERLWRALARDASVLAIEEDRPLVPALVTAIDAGRVRPLHAGEVTLRGGGVVLDGTGAGIAIVDGGFDCLHPDLVKRCVPGRNLIMFPPDTLVTPPGQAWHSAPFTDLVGLGHGTHVAGISLGDGSASDGRLRGVAPAARLYSYTWGPGSTLSVLLAWDHLLGHLQEPGEPRVVVVSNSFGWLGSVAVAQEVMLRKLIAAGVTVVFSAGNNGDSGPEVSMVNALCGVKGSDGAPLGGLICVANYADADIGTVEGGIHFMSSRGRLDDPASWPDLAAPGTDILAARSPTSSTLGTEGAPHYTELTGTSMAAPFVAGVVALIHQARREADLPPLSPAEIEAVLKSSAHAFLNHAPFPNRHAGHGLLDARAAVETALGRDPTSMLPALQKFSNRYTLRLASDVGGTWVDPEHAMRLPGVSAMGEGLAIDKSQGLVLPAAAQIKIMALATDAGGTPLPNLHASLRSCVELQFTSGSVHTQCLEHPSLDSGDALCFTVGRPLPVGLGACAPSTTCKGAPACLSGQPVTYLATDGDLMVRAWFDLDGSGSLEALTDQYLERRFEGWP